MLPIQAKEYLVNAWHFVGSCGIGRVLDQELKVIGFDNLRVVDASAIPDMPENAGPAGTTYMLAEYAAERLIAEQDIPFRGFTTSTMPTPAPVRHMNV
ncbi:MAG: hypothetical protein HC767_11070 [Akkermansiaceae bacterium]|nr:hypothetical protein [Akkermansiaceae bacterium]